MSETYRVELHLSGLIGTVCHTEAQKIWIIGFFFENKLHWQFEIRLYYLKYVPVSTSFDHV